MPLKFYQSFDIREKDFGDLHCAECTRNGNSVDMLNFCIGCESLFCYQCLQDHTRSEGKLELQDGLNVAQASHKQASESNWNHKYRYNEDNNNSSKINHNFNQIAELKHKLLQAKTQLHQCIENDRTESQRRHNEIMEAVDIKINELRANVMKFLDEFHSNITEEIEDFHHKMEERYSERERSIEIVLAKTDVTLSHLHKAIAETNIAELKDIAGQTVAEAMNIIEDPENHYAKILNKAIDTEAENTSIIFEQCMDEFLCKVNALCIDSLAGDNFEVSHKPVCNSYNVQSQTDIAECDINGSCIMPDGTIVLTDWNNTNIKRLNKNYQVTETLDLPGIPWAVCFSGTEEVAVSLHYLQKIQFVSLTGEKMVLTGSFKVKNRCKGIACADNKIFVSCGGGGLLEGKGQVKVYATDGTLLETLNTKSAGNQLLLDPQHITISADMSRMYVADKNLGLVMIDMQTKIQTVPYESEQPFRKPTECKGICLIGDSHILVCDFIQNGLVLHNSATDSAQQKSVLLDKSDGINNPQSLCYNKSSSTLVVTSGNTNLIQVFKLKIM